MLKQRLIRNQSYNTVVEFGVGALSSELLQLVQIRPTAQKAQSHVQLPQHSAAISATPVNAKFIRFAFSSLNYCL
jgi:hypothetical protein